MDIEAYIKEQNALISMIAFYMLFTLLQEASFAAMLKASPKLLKRSTALITPFSAIMCKFVFIADGLIKKNIYQIKAYSFLIIYALTMACFGFIKTKGTSLIFNYIAVILICLDGIYTFYQVRRLSHKYAWHFYKKLGLSEELQSVNKLKQRLNVFYTLNVFLSITNFSYPVNSPTIVTVCNYTCLVLTLATAFFFTQWIDEENCIVRKITIGITATELILEFIEFLILIKNIIFYNIFVLVSLFFSTINSILLICYLYFDMQTFGNGYTYALKQNVRRIRDKIENEN